MQKKLVAKLIYRSILCVVSAFACLLSLGVFYIGKNGGNTFSWGFLKYYTNLSNYVVFVVSAIVMGKTVKEALSGKEEIGHKLLTFKFMTLVMILVTFLVVIFLLDSPLHADYWLNVGNMAYHCIAPLLFVIDYFLFDRKCSLSVFAPLYSLVIPLVYVGYIFLLGAVIPEFVYPYFFLDVNTLGYGGVLIWVLVLFCVFAALGYLLWLFNRLRRKDGKLKFDFSHLLRPESGEGETKETEETARADGEPLKGEDAA